jgi:hypothetical protein
MSKQIKSIIFGLGGYDESKPNDNIIEVVYYTAEELAEIEAEKSKEANRQALLDKLGITAEEAQLLLGGK